MSKIYKLEPHVANLIAAGEVVERPASVVKELVENSIDAGAGIITVEIESGGMTYIRVTDDGSGIALEDAPTAFLRHATSKLRTEDGLEAITTLGFRGEALAAIASVSRVELITCQRGASEGTRVTLDGGTVTDLSPAGCPAGTTIIVRDLFYNTPARLKFMKTDRAEGSGAYSAVVRCALAHPEVSVRFIKDGKTEFHTPGDSRAESCLYSLFGRDFASGLLTVSTSDEVVSVEGFVSKPEAAKGNRNYQFFFVNGRHIKSRTLQAALEQAYSNTLPHGRYPSCALYITISCASVDVNVHPAKTEVRFQSDKLVFDGVYYAARGSLEAQAAPPPIVSERTAALLTGSGFIPDEERCEGQYNPQRQKESGGFRSMPAEEYRRSFKPGGFKTSVPPDIEAHSPPPVRNETIEPYQTRFTPPNANNVQGCEFRVVGEAMDTYIVVEYRGGMWLIDKHAAHERIRFDALRAGAGETMSQALITPLICRPGYEETALVLENAELFGRLGFTAEAFGDDSIAVRRIPSDLSLEDAETAIGEICAELKRGGVTEAARRDSILRSIACKTAVRAGDNSDIRELEELVRRVLSGEVRQCPHGRPVAIELTKSAIERSFKRT